MCIVELLGKLGLVSKLYFLSFFFKELLKVLFKIVFKVISKVVIIFFGIFSNSINGRKISISVISGGGSLMIGKSLKVGRFLLVGNSFLVEKFKKLKLLFVILFSYIEINGIFFLLFELFRLVSLK